ncbi:MAG: outer membrane lipoprotein-sorting protein [Gammaproteobacteria bacterium]|nr:outer membrane lipoprotein-sorting protein [Gammaproteobacteria bacterium]
MFKLTVSLLALSLTALPLHAAPSARQIMQHSLDLDDGSSRYSQARMMSCAFVIKKGKRKCRSKPRLKLTESLGKDVGAEGKDSLSLSLILKPSSEKGMAFLQKDYDDTDKDSEQWMYLPAMKKLKRIVSETDDGPKTGTLFGSELAYEDIEKHHINDSSYKLLEKNLSYGKRTVWKIKATPTEKFAPKTSYGHSVVWIDQQHYLPLKIELYNRQGKLAKTLLQQKIQQINGIWIAKRMQIINHSNQRMSLMVTDKLALNVDVPDGLLESRALKDSNYRETQMKALRMLAK